MLLALRSQWESQLPKMLLVVDETLDVVAVVDQVIVADGAQD